jgi:hypothetical protein
MSPHAPRVTDLGVLPLRNPEVYMTNSAVANKF